MRTCAVALSCLLALAPAMSFAAPPKPGVPPSKAERKSAALVKEAERYYGEGKYREAADVLVKANALDPHPRLLYNIGRAYDQAGDLTLSIEHYRLFLKSEEELDPSLIKKATLAIDRLRALLAKEDTAKQLQDAERQRLEREAQSEREKAKAEAADAQKTRNEFAAKEQAREDAEKAAAARSKSTSYIAAGAAGVGLATWVTFGVLASGSRNRFTAANTKVEKLELQNTTRTQALIADVGLVAALAGATTAFFFWPKAEDPNKEVSVTLVPAWGGAGMEVRF
jgi:tetratricopeptide (TPR) repeat protein